MNIIVTGSLAYDRIMDFPDRFKEHILPDKIHMLNVCFVVEKLAEQFGGCAGNITYNLKLLGLNPITVGAVGKDFGLYAEHFKKLGIKTDGIKIFPDDHTAIATIVTDLDDNQITAFYSGALAQGAGVPIPTNFKKEDSFLVVAPSSKEEMMARCLWAKERHLPYLFDPGQQITALSDGELNFGAEHAQALIFNDYEWQLFQDKTSTDRAGWVKKEKIVIVTQGHEGSVIYDKNNEYQIDAARADEVLDPTGAGDAYRAGIVAGIINKWDWQTTGQTAAAIASFAVEKYGTQVHRPILNEIRDRYRINFNSLCPL